MFELIEAYDDPVAICHIVAISEGFVSAPATEKLQVLMEFTEARAYMGLHALSEQEREDVIEGLDALYETEARNDLITIMKPSWRSLGVV